MCARYKIQTARPKKSVDEAICLCNCVLKRVLGGNGGAVVVTADAIDVVECGCKVLKGRGSFQCRGRCRKGGRNGGDIVVPKSGCDAAIRDRVLLRNVQDEPGVLGHREWHGGGSGTRRAQR